MPSAAKTVSSDNIGQSNYPITFNQMSSFTPGGVGRPNAPVKSRSLVCPLPCAAGSVADTRKPEIGMDRLFCTNVFLRGVVLVRPLQQVPDFTESLLQKGGFRKFGFHEGRLEPRTAAGTNPPPVTVGYCGLDISLDSRYVLQRVPLREGQSGMTFRARTSFTIFYFTLILSLCTSAQEPASPGVTSTEIRIGNITCVTGWAKAYASVSRAEAAYFQMVNERGGIHGRKINFLSLDEGARALDPSFSFSI